MDETTNPEAEVETVEREDIEEAAPETEEDPPAKSQRTPSGTVPPTGRSAANRVS